MATMLRQSTTVTIRLGAFVDKTDGVSAETGLTPAIEVSKNHAAFGARNSATAVAHDAAGWYSVELDGTDTGTLGPMIVKSDDDATHLPVWREFMVVPAVVYDATVAGTDNLQVDAVQLAGQTITAGAGVTFPASVGTSTLTQTQVTGGAYSLQTDGSGYVKVSAGTGTGQLSLASGVIASNLIQIDGLTTNDQSAILYLRQLNIYNTSGNAVEIFTDAGHGISISATGGAKHGIYTVALTDGDGIHAEGFATGAGIMAQGGATSGHGVEFSAGTNGNGIYANGAGGGSGMQLEAGATGHAVRIAAGGTSGDVFSFTAVGGGSLALPLVTTVTTLTGHTAQTGDTYALANGVNGFVALKAETALIVADTAELQTDWANGGRLDLILDIIAADVVNLDGAAMRGTDNAGLETTLTAIKGATFDTATDSLEALRNRGDAAWITATGFATPTNITAGTITTVTNLTNLPATAALEATLTSMKGATFVEATDSLEALRNRGDAAWITATGFATPTNITAGTITTVGSVTGAVGSVTGNVTGSVGSISAITFPTNFSLLTIDGDGKVVASNVDTVGGVADWTAAERAQMRQALGITGTTAASSGTGTLSDILAAAESMGAA